MTYMNYYRSFDEHYDEAMKTVAPLVDENHQKAAQEAAMYHVEVQQDLADRMSFDEQASSRVMAEVAFLAHMDKQQGVNFRTQAIAQLFEQCMEAEKQGVKRALQGEQ